MAAPIPNAFLEKISITSQGVHSGIKPTELLPSQLAWAQNITNRGGRAGTRPAIRKIKLTWPAATKRFARFQGAGFYEANLGGQSCLLAAISGSIYRFLISGNIGTVQNISLGGDLNDPNVRQVWMFQGENFEFINDAQSNPLFWDGAGLRRSKGIAGSELPAGAMGHYSNGRIVMALPDRKSYIAGDLVYSRGTSGGYGGRDAILKTTENKTILGGAAFGVPANAGIINAISSAGVPDTFSGQGPTQIGTRKGIFTVNLPLNAQDWIDIQFPSQTNSLPSYGPLSQNGTVTINADLWYRSVDGFRSFAIARRDYNTWVQTPLSTEMTRVLKSDIPFLLGFGSGVVFQNRLLETCSPYEVKDRGVAHRGLIALDFNNVSSITQRSNPDYDGLWTGLPILQILTGTIGGVERCFIFALDCTLGICLYELHPDEAYSFDFDGVNDVQIGCAIESRALWGMDARTAYGQEYQPDSVKLPLKKLLTADLFPEKITGTVNVKIRYKSDQNPNFVDWHSFSFCATSKDCSTANCPTFQDVQQQFATFVRLPSPKDDCNTITGRLMRTGYFFQLRFEWKGHMQLHQALIWAVPIPETIPECPTNQACTLVEMCLDPLFDYSIEAPCGSG